MCLTQPASSSTRGHLHSLCSMQSAVELLRRHGTKLLVKPNFSDLSTGHSGRRFPKWDRHVRILPASLIFIKESGCQTIAGDLPESCYGKQPQKLQPTWLNFPCSVLVLAAFLHTFHFSCIFSDLICRFWYIMNLLSTWTICGIGRAGDF